MPWLTPWHRKPDSKLLGFCGTSRAYAGFVALCLRDLFKQLRCKADLGAPARWLLDAGGTFHFHGALVGLAAQGAISGINGGAVGHGFFMKK